MSATTANKFQVHLFFDSQQSIVSDNSGTLTFPNPNDPDINLRVGPKDTLDFVSTEDFRVTISPEAHTCPSCGEQFPAGPKKNLFTGKDNEDFKDDSKGKKKVSCGAVHSHFGPGELPCAYKYTATANSGKKIDPHIIVA